MHFALPPRKTSRPPPYTATRSPYYSYFRRARLRSLAVILGTVVLLIFVLSQLKGADQDGAVDEEREEEVPPGTPEVVIVTVLDEQLSQGYRDMVVRNREMYAARHGYATFLPNLTTYSSDDPDIASSWFRIPATRHAMSLFPHTRFLFHLDHSALIMQPSLPLSKHILSAERIASLQLPDKPVVPPDSVIKTSPQRRFDQVDFILSQDHQGLAQTSFLLRTGEWAKFFLDAWYDPLYRSYNFQRAEGHALEHLVQWHGTVLSRMVLLPQRIMNAYTAGANPEETYKDGDFVANLIGCWDESNGYGDSNSHDTTCEDEAKPLFAKFVERFKEGERV